MKQRLWLLISLFCLSACTSAISNDGIVLRTYRQGTVFPSYPTEVVNTDGSGPVGGRLPGKLGDSPEWSPDGQWVASNTSQYGDIFASEDGSAIYITKSDGSQRRRITDQGGYLYPTWSPDSTHIACYRYADDGIYIFNVECFLRKEKCDPESTFLTKGRSPDWSPDGKRIAYESLDYDIFIINADGTGEPVNLTPTMGTSHDPKWSPDGRKIAFSSYQVGEDHHDIFIMNADGSDLKNLTNGNGSSTNPRWSPDGGKIAFVSTRDGSGQMIGWWDPIHPRALFLMNADGTDVIRLSPRYDEEVLWYAWLPSTPETTEP
jgi:Tol biopolymer transport system component